MSKTLVNRFWAKVSKRGHGGCWMWTASLNKSYRGYGQFMVATGDLWLAHRWAWVQAHGHPGKLFVLHRCDNPHCVNVDHLFLGTLQDNHRDMVEKGRHTFPVLHGESNGNAKLTWKTVREIRRRYARGGVTYRDLSSEYGVGHDIIGTIVRRSSWKETQS